MDNQTPIRSTAFWRRATAPYEAAKAGPYAVDPQENITAFSGPAILFGAGGVVLFANGGAERLVRAIAAGELAEVRTLLVSVAANGRPALGQIFFQAIR